MNKRIDKKRNICPVETALVVLVGKWKILILWYLEW